MHVAAVHRLRNQLVSIGGEDCLVVGKILFAVFGDRIAPRDRGELPTIGQFRELVLKLKQVIEFVVARDSPPSAKCCKKSELAEHRLALGGVLVVRDETCGAGGIELGEAIR
jgi:hypothetical protein